MAGELVIKDYKRVFWLFEMGRADEVTWTKWPVSRNSTSYRRLMLTPAGRSAFCVFNGIVRLVSRERTGGMLAIRGREMTAEDIHTETGIPPKDVRAGLELLKSQDIAWIITVDEQIRLDKERERPGSRTDAERASDGLKTFKERPPLATHASFSSSGSGSDSSSSGKELLGPLFPSAIDRPEFATKWREWLAYRSERRLAKYTARSEKAQLERCASWGIRDAMAAIDNAIANAWQGLFPPKGKSPTKATERRAAQAAKEYPDDCRLPVAG